MLSGFQGPNSFELHLNKDLYTEGDVWIAIIIPYLRCPFQTELITSGMGQFILIEIIMRYILTGLQLSVTLLLLGLCNSYFLN